MNPSVFNKKELNTYQALKFQPQDNVCLGILENQELGPEFENLNIMGGNKNISKASTE